MNILVIRTDNIGDLVCTTPLLTALRAQYPTAWIGVLANSYSASVLTGHPAIDAVFEYSKVKHLGRERSILGSYWDRVRTILQLRAKSLDLILVPSVAGQRSALRFARWLGARQIVINEDSAHRHEVEKVYAVERLLPQRLAWPPPACSVVAAPGLLPDALRSSRARDRGGLRLGLHISARKPSQRWPAHAFVTLAHRFVECYPGSDVLLFWSPGSEQDAKHPGDDEKAQEIIQSLGNSIPLLPVPTQHLPELVAGLADCDVVIQSDGGAMHMAAALGKPIVCFFGESDAARWHPWGSPHRLLQPPSRQVADIPVEDVLDALQALICEVKAGA